MEFVVMFLMRVKKEHNVENNIRQKYKEVSKYLNEKSRRIWAATEAKSLGRGGISIVTGATGITYKTIKRGLNELIFDPLEKNKIRSKGGGRKNRIKTDRRLESNLRILVEASTRGDPESPLLWTCKSTYNLCDELTAKGHSISQKSIYTMLRNMGYSLQGNRKPENGRGRESPRSRCAISIYS